MSTHQTNPTIIDLKTAFLRTQILALSTPLHPSSSFTTSNTNAAQDNPLREKAIDEALYKLNAQLKKHNKLAYGPQATRHVAEQVDRLYWNAGERGGVVSGGGEEWRERGSDLRNEEVIEQLPEEWNSAKAPELAEKYGELQARLRELDVRRRAVREKVEGYRKMKALLGPFGEDGGVQENLVTKNGEVEKELERMRMLMLRVGEGVGRLEGRGKGEEMEVDWEGDGERKVEELLKRR